MFHFVTRYMNPSCLNWKTLVRCHGAVHGPYGGLSYEFEKVFCNDFRAIGQLARSTSAVRTFFIISRRTGSGKLGRGIRIRHRGLDGSMNSTYIPRVAVVYVYDQSRGQLG
ncbi:hypothetical protein PAXRUDRAFT_304486 [Paxillus rubicundulus Ve08.2h10]|uniref:Uncharacterized protein n=1 Tax=Paxillus rubicundulus Ve08.2h10 TaxID=930991 RepID=A0A0D0C7J9_9AGAM|nr:hypothetical protein PAXRUDRAFT_304486 [Paxillus rubicundulus Ve08.2h10]